jgi:hypothetical protein
MARSPVYADKVKPSAQLMKSSEDLIRHAQRELFAGYSVARGIGGIA